MSLLEKIDQDLKKAMIQKDETVVSVLRLVKNALHNEEIAKKKKKLSDQEALAVLTSQAKKRKESIEAFKKGERSDLAAHEEEELKVIEKYLPQQLPTEEIKKIVQEIVSQMGEEKDFGKAMGQTMGRLKGQADGKVVAQLVKESLNS